MATSPQTSPKTFGNSKLTIVGIAVVIVLILAAILAFVLTRTPATIIEPADLSEYVNDQTGIDWSNSDSYQIQLSESLTITNSGIYHLSGEISDGVVAINTDDNVKLVLDNVKIHNSTGPAIVIQNAKNVVIYLVGENQLEDGSSYKNYADDEIGVIFSHDDLFFDGDGKLTIKSNLEDAIVSKDDLKFFGGSYIITAADDAIRGKDSVIIESGDFQIKSTGAGIKSTNSTDDGKGNIVISGGSFVLDCIDDAVHAYGEVEINSGDFTISSNDDAVHADGTLTINGGKISINKSYEGLEGEKVIINDGEISLVASDDGINAAGGNDASGMMGRSGFGTDQFHSNSNSEIRIRGGKVIVNANGDGIDSNGNLYIEGGENIVYGPTSGADGALDYDGEMIMTGGRLLAGGSNGMAQGTGSESTIYSANIFFNSIINAGTKVTIVDANDQIIASYSSSKNFNLLVVALPEFVKDQTYTIKLNDETYQNFTISSITTQVGSGNMGNDFHGGAMNGSMPTSGAFPDRNQMRR